MVGVLGQVADELELVGLVGEQRLGLFLGHLAALEAARLPR